VVFTSGFSEEMTGQAFDPRKVARFLHKPYPPRVLAKTVREVLDARLAPGMRLKP
jgi:hypothetical protein